METVFVGMSGGVDSSVAALLLKQKGYNVVGIFMKNWEGEEEDDECPWIEDSNEALMVANQIGIPFQIIDFTKEYAENILEYMFREYSQGKTPNPDILCNREIKFKFFLEKCISLGADLVATGHYAKIENDEGNFLLQKGSDHTKDQSYFLCQLNQEQLSKVLFPIGDILKSEVRKIAQKNNLVNHNKKDSQGLCFVGKISLPIFLQKKLSQKTGDVFIVDRDVKFKINQNDFSYIYDKENLKKIGEHTGAHFYTIGQRKGLNIGGFRDPLYILETDTKNNRIIVGEGENHPLLWRKHLYVEKIHWITPSHFDSESIHNFELEARIRYRQKLIKIELSKYKNGWKVTFENPISAITKGQFLSIYEKENLVASAEIL